MKLAVVLSSLNVEIGGCLAIWTGSALYAMYRVHVASGALDTADDVYGDFSDGLFYLARKRDVSDFEWHVTKRLLIRSVPWFAFNFLVSEYLRNITRFRCVSYFQVATSFLYILSEFNATSLTILLCQPIVFEILTKLCRRAPCVWTCGITFIFVLAGIKYFVPAEYFAFSVYVRAQCIVSFAWINLRCWSYYADVVKTTTSSHFVSALAYCFYLPLFYCGPFVRYEQFEFSQRKPTAPFRTRAKALLFDLARFSFWMLVVDVSLHFLYVGALSFRPELVDGFDSWTRCGLCYSMGQFFHMKYVVFYGLSTSLARAESIPAPNTPKCIARIHLYSDMWRYFDSGLYTFLVRYIYVPTLKLLKPYFPYRAPATILTFLFIYVWHGTERHVFVWAALNYAVVTLEALVKHSHERLWRPSYDDYLGPVWQARIGCLLAAPLLAVSIASSSFFFAGTYLGNVFFRHLFQDGFQSSLVLVLVLYCFCRFANHLRNLESSSRKASCE